MEHLGFTQSRDEKTKAIPGKDNAVRISESRKEGLDPKARV